MHTRERFDQALDGLKESILAMIGRVEEQMALAIAAYQTVRSLARQRNQ